MKTRITLTNLLLCLTLTVANVFGSFYRPDDDTIVGRTRDSVLIVAGKVTDLQYVEPDGRGVYTDVTITVSKVLKGEPNIDDQTVRFRVEGGIMEDGFALWVSTVSEFPIGDELIFFIQRQTWRSWAYDGLYPMMHCYPKIVTEQVDGQPHEIVRFDLKFFGDEYSINLPVELAFRLIENAIEAPEAVALLEGKIRAIKDIQKEKIRAIKDTQRKEHEVESSTMFLSILEWELTQIEARIKNKDKPPPYVIDVQKLAGTVPETADQLLKEMVPCKLMLECRMQEEQNNACVEIISCWEVAKGETPDITRRLHSRYYDIENGRILLNFDAPDQEQVNEVHVAFGKYLNTTDVLRRLGYDPTKQMTHHLDPKLCFFYTKRYLHEVVRRTEQPTTVTVYLRVWED